MFSKLLSSAPMSFFSDLGGPAKILKHLGLRQDYDLPLNKSADSSFLVLLIALMSFLAVLACSGIFALNSMTERWSSGLENKVTIEIVTETKDGHLLSTHEIAREAKKVAEKLENMPAVKSLHILSETEIQDLIAPWIGGDGLTLDDIPLPGLIALELHSAKPEVLEKIKKEMSLTSQYAHLDTHHEWLEDLIRFIRVLKLLSYFIALIIGGATIIAITAGIRARLAIHSKEVTLLHAIGATDNYIARQFQRHAMILAVRGGVMGTIAGLLVTLIVVLTSSSSSSSLIPDIDVHIANILFLCLIPFIAAFIATLTSRFTVLHNLAEMP